MLTKVDKVLIVVWMVPLAIGVVAAFNAAGDHRMILTFLTAITGVLYVVTVISMFFFARRRRYWAAKIAQGDPEAQPVEGRMFHPGHGYIDTPRARGRSLVAVHAWKLLFIIPVAVYLVITQGQWTAAILALQIVTVLTMTVYATERETELDPAK